MTDARDLVLSAYRFACYFSERRIWVTKPGLALERGVIVSSLSWFRWLLTETICAVIGLDEIIAGGTKPSRTDCIAP